MRKTALLLGLLVFLMSACSHIEREARVDILVSNPMPDPHLIQTDADPKGIEVHMSSSVKDTEKEVELLKCLTISELQKAGWKAQATAGDCNKCEKIVHNYGTYERVADIYGPFQCQASSQLAFLDIDIDIKHIKKVGEVSRLLWGGMAGRAGLQTEITISAISRNGKIKIVTADISSKAPGSTFGFFQEAAMSIGNTQQSINETASQIAKILEQIAQNEYFRK